MELKAEKRLLAALGVTALLVVLLLPLVFRELEPDYETAYGMEEPGKRRFAAKGAPAPVLPGLTPLESPPAAATAGGSRLPGVSPHRALPLVRPARIATPDTAEASSAPDFKNSAPVVRIAAGASGGGPSDGAQDTTAHAGGARLEETRLALQSGASAPKLQLVPGAAEAAALAKSVGLKDVAGLALAGGDLLGANAACADAARELKPRIASATTAHKRANDELKASACPADACGRYADDCIERERTEEEGRVARRRCACDRLACRVKETCRTLDELTCEQEKACSQGKPASCVPRC